MKRSFVVASLLVATTAGLVTGCSGAPVTNTQNTQNAAATNTVNATTPAANTPSTNSVAGNTAVTNSASSAQTIAQFKTIASGLVSRYVNSHNDKTLPEYKVDVNQILIPGLAKVVGEGAKKGVDFDNPVKGSNITVSHVEPENSSNFRAQVAVHLKYGSGKTEQTIYHVMCIQDQSTQQWLIESIA